jgi:hypothetical protein
MAVVTGVLLPREAVPVFPSRCVVCRAEKPANMARLIGRNGLHGHAIWAGWYRVSVPSCRACGLRLQLWWAWDTVRSLVIAGACFAFGGTYLGGRFEGWVTGLIVLGLIGVSFLAMFCWNRVFPPAFSVDPGMVTMEYEFRDADTAREFALLNLRAGSTLA